MKIIGIKYIYLYLSCIIHVERSVSTSLKKLNELVRIINRNPNNTWIAGLNNTINQLEFGTLDSQQKGYLTNRKMKTLFKYFNLYTSKTLPAFDARSKWASFEGDPNEKCPTIRKVYNSGKCKCGWAISIASVVSDRLCIATNFKMKQPLSAQNLISCCPQCCSCNGGNLERGWDYVKQVGLVTGGAYKSNIGCQPYLLPPCQRTYECSTENIKIPKCKENICKPSDGTSNKTESTEVNQKLNEQIHIHDYYTLSRKKPSKIMNDLMENGPLQVSMHMYEDFRVYTKGLYTHVVGDFVCDHAVKLIGWGTEDEYKYWILMNSFGPLWGENGLFRIPMNSSGYTDFGYGIIGPKFQINKAYTQLDSVILLCVTQIFKNLC